MEEKKEEQKTQIIPNEITMTIKVKNNVVMPVVIEPAGKVNIQTAMQILEAARGQILSKPA